MSIREPIRVLVADDEQAIREAYCEVLAEQLTSSAETLRILRSQILDKTPESRRSELAQVRTVRFDVVCCASAAAALDAAREARAAQRPFAVAFLDMRMPPGHDGQWAAAQIRAVDPDIEIVICTAYADIDPAGIAALVPPEDKLFYIEKPFHPFEVRQMAAALGSKWNAERNLARLAYYDTLTGLSNRANFRRRLVAAVDTAQAQQRALAVMYVDLDNFKRINDTLGHAAGDELLCVVAERLRVSLRSDDAIARDIGSQLGSSDVARLGGDEFVLLVTDLDGPHGAAIVADRIVRNLTNTVTLGNHGVMVTASVGVSMFPTDATRADDLFRQADLAMYFAKQQGMSRFAFYDPAMSAGALQRLTLESKLRHALAANEFSLHYQPQFDLQSGMISGMEALLRWTNAELGAVPPGEFIPLAEETGLILPIGEWVLRTACAQQRAWLDEGLPSPRVAVNVSGAQFAQPEFPQLVAAVLRETRLDTSALELEITESTIMQDEARAQKSLDALKALGVSLAIDDFGTGYSSLSRLREFPVDRLKVDRSFVRHITTSSSDRTIAEAIIAMAKALQLGVVAEGVEDFSQLLHLQEQQCQLAQGFLLSRPMPKIEAGEFLLRLGQQIGTRTQRLRRLVK